MVVNGVESSCELPYMENQFIDYSLLSSPSPVIAAEELKKLHAALNTWGCFQLVNHGMSEEYLDEIRNVGKQFLGLPQEEKEKYARTPTNVEGYGNDSITSRNVPLTWQYRLILTTYPIEDRKLDRWPQTPHNFSELLNEYSMKVKRLHDTLVQNMALCLNLEENSFLEEYGETFNMISRFNLYIPCDLIDQIRASSIHADSSAMTFLLQDKQLEALEVQKDGNWFKAPVFPRAIFVNVGDQMEIMSNGIFKSAIHRVVPHPEKERISIPMFCSPAHHKEIGPLKALITEHQPPAYRRVNNYRDIFFRYHPTTTRPISTVKISNKRHV
ncbi:Codeine O-demethylase [Bienertia sinuspersici]